MEALGKQSIIRAKRGKISEFRTFEIASASLSGIPLGLGLPDLFHCIISMAMFIDISPALSTSILKKKKSSHGWG